MQKNAETTKPFRAFMTQVADAARLTDEQRQSVARVVDRYRGQRLWVTPMAKPAEVQIAYAVRFLAERMTRGEAAAALRGRFGISYTASYARVRKALDRRRPDSVDARAATLPYGERSTRAMVGGQS